MSLDNLIEKILILLLGKKSEPIQILTKKRYKHKCRERKRTFLLNNHHCCNQK